MNKCRKKNILYIKNLDYKKYIDNGINLDNGKNLDYLKTFSNVYLQHIMSVQIIDYNIDELKKLIEPFDIIILGGGPQHLTTDDYQLIYPEIKNQIEIVKLVSSLYYKKKLLIGICLGCQIIGLSFGFKIVSSEKLIIGFDYLDTKTIDYKFINNSNDNYLNKLDFNLLAKSFSFHNDYIDFKYGYESNKAESNKDELNLIAQSTKKHPYILNNKNLNIYGFQFHPEICFNSIFDVVNLFLDSSTIDFDLSIYNSKQYELEKIYKHFFDIFINN